MSAVGVPLRLAFAAAPSLGDAHGTFFVNAKLQHALHSARDLYARLVDFLLTHVPDTDLSLDGLCAGMNIDFSGVPLRTAHDWFDFGNGALVFREDKLKCKTSVALSDGSCLGWMIMLCLLNGDSDVDETALVNGNLFVNPPNVTLVIAFGMDCAAFLTLFKFALQAVHTFTPAEAVLEASTAAAAATPVLSTPLRLTVPSPVSQSSDVISLPDFDLLGSPFALEDVNTVTAPVADALIDCIAATGIDAVYIEFLTAFLTKTSCSLEPLLDLEAVPHDASLSNAEYLRRHALMRLRRWCFGALGLTDEDVSKFHVFVMGVLSKRF